MATPFRRAPPSSRSRRWPCVAEHAPETTGPGSSSWSLRQNTLPPKEGPRPSNHPGPRRLGSEAEESTRGTRRAESHGPDSENVAPARERTGAYSSLAALSGGGLRYCRLSGATSEAGEIPYSKVSTVEIRAAWDVAPGSGRSGALSGLASRRFRATRNDATPRPRVSVSGSDPPVQIPAALKATAIPTEAYGTRAEPASDP